MAISTADPASLASDPPFLLRHPRARGDRGFMAFLTGIRSEPPRMMLPRFEPAPAEEASVELLQPEQALFEALPVEEIVQSPAIEAVPSVASLTAPVIVPRRRSWGRRIVGGLLSAAAYTVTSLLLLAAAPVYLVMSDRQDVVRWSNEPLDLVARW